LIPIKDEQSDGTGKPCINLAGFIYLGCQRVYRYVFFMRNFYERLPERVFQRHTGTMTAQG